MKKLLLIVIITTMTAMCTTSYAQNYEDVVYLKNSSIIRGVIIEQTPNESLKIETKDGSIFVYKFEDILKFGKETPKQYSQVKKQNKGRYYGNINLGYGLKLHSLSDLVDLQIINGYQFNSGIALGIGIGLKMDFQYAIGLSVPIFAHFRYNFLKSNITPFASLNVGYNINLDHCFFNGFYTEPTFGVGFGVSPKTKLNLSVGYSLNNAQYSIRGYYSYSYQQAMWGMLKFGFGVTF